MQSRLWKDYFDSRWDKTAHPETHQVCDGTYNQYAKEIGEDKAWWGILEMEAACIEYAIQTHIHPVKEQKRTEDQWYGPVL